MKSVTGLPSSFALTQSAILLSSIILVTLLANRFSPPKRFLANVPTAVSDNPLARAETPLPASPKPAPNPPPTNAEETIPGSSCLLFEPNACSPAAVPAPHAAPSAPIPTALAAVGPRPRASAAASAGPEIANVWGANRVVPTTPASSPAPFAIACFSS